MMRDATCSVVMVPAWPGQHTRSDLERLAVAGQRPRTDYVELASALGGDVMDMEYMTERASPAARAVARSGKVVHAQVVEAFVRRNRFRHIVARADRLGLPLALLLKLARARRDLVLISVWLSRPKKAVFLSHLKVHSHLQAIVNYSSTQMEIAARKLRVPQNKLVHLLHPVDERFWVPRPPASDPLLCSVGVEARDYPTLLEALRGLDVRAELAVGTTVFGTGNVADDLAPYLTRVTAAAPPPNVVLRRQLSHLELRELYTRSRFVVLPLHDVEFDAGVTVIAEAMAMGKAVVVSRTRGQVDLVRHGETGLYVPPGDPRALRAAIEHLLAHPAEAERMGRAGRAFAEARLRLDHWVSSVAQVTLSARQ